MTVVIDVCLMEVSELLHEHQPNSNTLSSWKMGKIHRTQHYTVGGPSFESHYPAAHKHTRAYKHINTHRPSERRGERLSLH